MIRLRGLALKCIPLFLILVKSASAGFSLGFGPTYLRYKEDPGSVNISEAALTLKISSNHKLTTNALQFHTNIFGNPVVYQLSGKKNPPARFIGANARLSLGFDLGSLMGVRLGVGGYGLAMLVDGDAYGLKYLGAPQATLTFEKNSKSRGRYWALYGKYAPLRKRASYELGAGLSIQLNSPQAGKSYPIMLTLDFSKTRVSQFTFAGKNNGMTLYTGSLGFSFAISSDSSSSSSSSSRRRSRP